MIKGSGTASFNRPVALMCYICGREYGTKSLGIHLKTCQQKWEVEEAKKPRAQRRPLPLPPNGLNELLSKSSITASDIGDFNNGAYNKYNNEALVRCKNCNRTFKPEALAHHQKACTAANPFKPLPGAGGQGASMSEFPDEGEGDGGNLKPCIFCNRKFAADRVAKHESVCTKMDKSKLQTPQKLGELKKGTGGTIRSTESGSGNSASSVSSYGSPMKQPLRPKALMCFICGREYGTKSLKIHIKSCEEKWHNEQAKLAKSARRPMPQAPMGLMELLDKDEITFEDLERYNNKAYDSYKYTALNRCNNCNRTFTTEAMSHHSKVCTPENPFKPLNRPEGGSSSSVPSEQDTGSGELAPCCKCGRKFAPDRIAKHEMVCKGTNSSSTGSASEAKGSAPSSAPIIMKKTVKPAAPPIPVITRPKTLVCYICGREFGTASLSIHLKSCEQKWYNEQDKLPKKDRRPLPTPPPQLAAMLRGEISSDQLDNYNVKAFDTYNTDSLLPCKFCNRTFTQTALAHHSKVCTAEKPFKPLNRPNPASESSGGEGDIPVPSKGYNLSNIPEEAAYGGGAGGDGDGDLVPCSKCGRNFNSDRVAKHEKVCKGPTEKKVKEEPPKTEKPTKKGDPTWKKQHEEFIQSMQYMKKCKAIEESGGDIRQLGPPPKANTDNLVPCPYCNRKFNPQTAEKHIPSCKNVINKPKSVALSAPKTFNQQNEFNATQTKNKGLNSTAKTNMSVSKIKQPFPK